VLVNPNDLAERDDGVDARPYVTETLCLGFPTQTIAARHRVLTQPARECQGTRIGATLLGPACRPGYVLGACVCNALNALVTRHGVEPPAPVRVWNHALAYWDACISARPWLDVPFDPDASDWWMKRWPGGKQKAILSSQLRDDIMPDRLSFMVKREVYHQVPTKARLIQYYPNLATQAEHGPAFVVLQKAVFGWAPTYTYQGIRVTFGSGLDSGGLGRWMSEVHHRFRRPRFIERDGKNWDATMQRFHHNLKLRIYRAFDPRMADFVDRGFTATATGGFGDTVLRYRLDGTVKSGHNDTTLGNSIINASIAIEVLAELGIAAEVIVVGDDLLVAVEGDTDLSRVLAMEAEFGIRPEGRVFDSYLDVSFISGCWLRGGDGFIFVPKLGRLLARLWWTCSPPSRRREAEYRRGVVLGLRAAVGDVPLYSDFLVCDEGAVATLPRDYHMWVASFGGAVPSSATADDLCAKYHLTPSELDELGKYLRGLGSTKCLFQHPLAERVCDVDLADVLTRPIAAGAG
jgi:hypothetical protein